MPSSSYS